MAIVRYMKRDVWCDDSVIKSLEEKRAAYLMVTAAKTVELKAE